MLRLFHPSGIFPNGSSALGPFLQPVATDPLQLDNAIKAILRFSLLHREPDIHTLTIHRLVQAVLKDAMSEKVQDEWVRRTIDAVNATFPSVDFTRGVLRSA